MGFEVHNDPTGKTSVGAGKTEVVGKGLTETGGEISPVGVEDDDRFV